MDRRLWWVVAAVVVLWSGMDLLGGPAGGGPPPYRQFLGTWQGVDDEDVHLKLWMVATEQAGGCLGPVTVFDGRFELDGLLGDAPLEGGWNFAEWSPLVLNVVWEPDDGVRTAGSLAVRIDGEDALTVRASLDPSAPLQPGFLDGPDAVKLRRTAPPEGAVPPG